MKKLSIATAWMTMALALALAQGAEVFEANLGREAELPKGKEADGIRGDFVLRSDKVEALVSQNAPNRRANMSTFYGEDGVTPGCLFDLTLRGSNNDQLICYGPTGHGLVSYVRVVEGRSAIESVTTAAKNKGIYKRHVYEVKDGESGIWITTTLRNETDKPDTVGLKDDFVRFNDYGVADGIRWYSCVDPDHKAGYAVTVLKAEGLAANAEKVDLAPGKEVRLTRFLAVGTSALQAWGLAAQMRGDKVFPVTGKMVDEAGKPVSRGRLFAKMGRAEMWAYPDADGLLSLLLPAKSINVIAQDIGRTDLPLTLDVKEGVGATFEAKLSLAGGVDFSITDDRGRSVPCKAMFEGIKGTAQPELGPIMRAHGCKDQWHNENGKFFVALPAGSYKVRVTRGLEYSSLMQEVTVAPGNVAIVKGVLKRVVDTTGWVCSDFHNHSTQSGDNICGTDDRVINIGAENIEFAPTTEHNRFYDWEPHIAKLGLTPYIKTVKGIELTGSRQHFNSFPFEPDPMLQDGGAPVWNDDPRITAITLRRHQGESPTRWIQFNHPDLSNMFIDRDRDGIADGGFVGVGNLIDGTEVQNGNEASILEGAPFRVSRAPGSLAAKVATVREFIWLQLLNQGHRLVATAVADAHAIYGNGVAGWLTYVQSAADDPTAITWEDLAPRSKGGRIVLTNGPYLNVSTATGEGPGDDARSGTGVQLKVKIQCTDWVKVNRVQVLVNGRPDPKLNFTQASHAAMFKDGVVVFDQTLSVPLQQDAHLIVVALGEGTDLSGGYGTSAQSKMMPCGYNNPIYVDVDGNGFRANGDTLGYDLPVGGVTADKAKAILGVNDQPPVPAAK
jgi:hypothetical protein